jgi:putative ABC transport system permease protein
MLHNYLVTALRNFTRHKLYSFINIAGLTVGLTCAIFIILFVRDQLSYDRWIPGADNIYRVETTIFFPGEPAVRWAWGPFPMAQAMLDHIPEVRARTRLFIRPVTVSIGNRQFAEAADVVDPNFLDVIKLPLAMGEPQSVLARPDSVVLSQSLARKFFGGQNAAGKTIFISSDFCDGLGHCQIHQDALTVTGILRDLPHDTQFVADLMLSNTSRANSMTEEAKTSWTIDGTYSYVRLAPGANAGAVTAKLVSVIDRSVNLTKLFNIHMRGSQVVQPHLVPLRDTHLASDRYRGMKAGGSWAIVYGFSAIGILILLVACFNFTNLATARAMVRAREISLRKVAGATRKQLAIQFLGESVLTAIVALLLALALTEILTPGFDRFVGLPIALRYGTDWFVLLFILGIGLLAGLLSGIYPALVLSGFRPALALRTSSAGGQGSGLVRVALVVLQFAVSIGLGIAALVMFAQLSFAHGLDLGLRKDGVVIIDWNIPAAGAEVRSFTQALKANPGIADVAFSDDIPFSNNIRMFDVHVPGSSATEAFRNVPVSPAYFGLYGIKAPCGAVAFRVTRGRFHVDRQRDGSRQKSGEYSGQCQWGAAAGLFARAGFGQIVLSAQGAGDDRGCGGRCQNGWPEGAGRRHHLFLYAGGVSQLRIRSPQRVSCG